MRFVTKKRVAAAVAALAIGGGGVAAYAYFTSTGSGTGGANVGSATNFTVGNISASGTMYPGAGSSSVSYKVTNPGNGHQAVTGVTVAVAASGGNILSDATGLAVPGCSATWFTAAPSTFKASDGTTTVTTPVDLAPSDYITGTSVVTMTNAAVAQDACQGVSPRLTISVS